MTCVLRFSGAGVALGIRVEVGGGSGVKVSVAETIVGVGLSGVGEARSGAGDRIPHAEKVIINKTMDRMLIRACVNLICQSLGWSKNSPSHHGIIFICYNKDTEEPTRMISEFCTNLHWGGPAMITRIARLLAVCAGAAEEGQMNSIHDILAHDFL